MKTMLDAAGNQHERVTDDARIVSLVPSITELLFELGLGEQIVGRTGFCIHPADVVKRVTKVGGTKDVKLDLLRSLEPTHVIVNIDENTLAVYESLCEFVPHVIVTHPNSPLDNLDLFCLLGGVFNCQIKAQELCQQLEAGLHRVKALASYTKPNKRVLYLIWREPWMTVSAKTYVANMLALIGWEAVFPDSNDRYPALSDAQMAAVHAELCLLSSEPYPFREKHIAEVEQLAGCPALLIDGEMISWYGSRAIAGLEYLVQLASRQS